MTEEQAREEFNNLQSDDDLMDGAVLIAADE
jgi:hypothetical protein